MCILNWWTAIWACRGHIGPLPRPHHAQFRNDSTFPSVCWHVCMSVAHVCLCAYVCVCVHWSLSLCVCVRMWCFCVYASLYMYIYIYISIYAYVHFRRVALHHFWDQCPPACSKPSLAFHEILVRLFCFGYWVLPLCVCVCVCVGMFLYLGY